MIFTLNDEEKVQRGLSYEDYKSLFVEQIVNTNTNKLNEADKKKYDAKVINLHRSNRLEKTYLPNAEVVEIVSGINQSQFWLVLTESWCGDSAQNLPIIKKLSSLNENIQLRIFLRDSHLDIMDLYLTNSSRSIPKLIVFNSKGDELFRWGPRPKTAAELVKRLKSEGLPIDEVNKQLHLWYGRNRGSEVESELAELLRISNNIKAANSFSNQL